jgi:phage shock protein C
MLRGTAQRFRYRPGVRYSAPQGGIHMPVLRSRDDRMIAGVCGGLAKALGWSSTSVRILYVIVSILSAAFPGTLAYVILWILMPEE